MPRVDFHVPPRIGWHQVLRSEIESLGRHCASRSSTEVGRAAESTLVRTKRAAVAETAQEELEHVAGATRKIRNADEAAAVLKELGEAALSFCRRAVPMLHTGGRLVGFRSAGSSDRPAVNESGRLAFEHTSVPASARAVKTRDTVITQDAQHNTSQALSEGLANGEEDEVRVFPLVIRNTVIGAVVADGPTIRTPAIETSVLAREARIEAIGSRRDSKAHRSASLG